MQGESPLVISDALRGRHFVRVADWTPAELLLVLDLAAALKLDQAAGAALLPQRALGLLFRRPSTRTRVSFEVAIGQLGGFAVGLPPDELQLSRGESLRDTAIVLSRYLDALVVRTLEHAEVEEIARHAAIPVVNGLTARAHPCQALADALTIRERAGALAGARVAWVGAGTNVCASLLMIAAKLGLDFAGAFPRGYEPPADVLAAAAATASETGARIELGTDPREAVTGADAVYTDVWTSMGQEDDRDRRRRDLAGYRLDEDLLARAGGGAVALHCLPAHHGDEVTESLLYGPRSAVWDQAENRLHVQKALLALIVR